MLKISGNRGASFAVLDYGTDVIAANAKDANRFNLLEAVASHFCPAPCVKIGCRIKKSVCEFCDNLLVHKRERILFNAAAASYGNQPVAFFYTMSLGVEA